MKAHDLVRRIEFRYEPLDVLPAKARRMSFFLTTAQVRARTKTVTRRAVGTWTRLQAGDKLVAIEKGQGLKAGDGHRVLALLEVVSVRVEQLDAITADDCAREGFPGVTPVEFVEFFLGSPTRDKADALATRGRIRGRRSVTHREEIAVVLYVQDADGEWRPSQVYTRRWIRFADGSDGWAYDLFDGSWCRRDQRLHLYKSGGGPPYVNGFADPGIHGRLWMLDGEGVTNGGSRSKRKLSDKRLLAMGIERTAEYPGDIFADATDEPTTYCRSCDDEIPRYSDPCKHLCMCDHCGAGYESAGDEEDRCPDCNTSQFVCDDCGEVGAEVCISCDRKVCSVCWPDHVDEEDAPCERGRPDWREPGSAGEVQP